MKFDLQSLLSEIKLIPMSDMNDDEKDYLNQLSKFHLATAIAVHNAANNVIERLANFEHRSFSNLSPDRAQIISNCFEKIKNAASTIDSQMLECKIIGMNNDDTLLIHEYFLDLINYFRKLEEAMPQHSGLFNSIISLKNELERKRPIISPNIIISPRLDRSGYFLSRKEMIFTSCPDKFDDDSKIKLVYAENANSEEPIKYIDYVGINMQGFILKYDENKTPIKRLGAFTVSIAAIAIYLIISKTSLAFGLMDYSINAR
jgi:hypothetical protein